MTVEEITDHSGDSRSVMAMRVLFVCTGNTCRSPMAAALLRDLIARDPRLASFGIEVDSAGLCVAAGSPAASGAQKAVRKRGLSLDDHAAQRVEDRVMSADLVLTMTEGHKTQALLSFPEAAGVVYTLKEYAGLPGSPDIADPFGQSDEVYADCLIEIEEAVRAAADRLAGELRLEGSDNGESWGEQA